MLDLPCLQEKEAGGAALVYFGGEVSTARPQDPYCRSLPPLLSRSSDEGVYSVDDKVGEEPGTAVVASASAYLLVKQVHSAASPLPLNLPQLSVPATRLWPS